MVGIVVVFSILNSGLLGVICNRKDSYKYFCASNLIDSSFYNTVHMLIVRGSQKHRREENTVGGIIGR